MSPEAPLSGRERVLRNPPKELCLRFVNTVAWRLSDTPEERLPSVSEFLDWCVGAELLAAAEAAQLAASWRKGAPAPLALYRRALALREALYRVFRSRIDGEDVPADALRIVNAALAAAPSRDRIVSAGTEFGWSVAGRRADAVDALAPIVWSAGDLLTSPRAHRMRQCEDAKGCGWLFLDASRGGTRRWCSMGGCGNRAKAQRHYLRRKRLARPKEDEAAPGEGAPRRDSATRSR